MHYSQKCKIHGLIDASSFSRQGKLICAAQFRHKETQSALQACTNYIKKKFKIAFKMH